MSQTSHKNYIIVIIILSLALVGFYYMYRPPKDLKVEVNLDKFPEVIGNWSGEDIPITDRTFEILNPDGLLFKEYTNKNGEKVQLVIVLGLNKRESFHPPEVCYSGEGDVVEPKKIEKITLPNSEELKVNKLVIKDKHVNVRHVVMFWFTAGNKHFANYYKQQLTIVWNEFKYRKSWGSLIRVSTNQESKENIAESTERIELFIREIYPLLADYINF